MDVRQLREKLAELLKQDWDLQRAGSGDWSGKLHEQADEALLQYIDDEAATELFMSITRRYA